VLGRVDGEAQICDLAVIAEDAHVGGRTIVCSDEIVRGEAGGPLEPRRAGALAGRIQRGPEGGRPTVGG
jgi:hypothetical protein